MTDTQHRTAGDGIDVRYTGALPPAEVLAERVRRHGWWYATEYNLVAAKAWIVGIAAAAIGNPLVYLLAMGLGLGAAVNASTGTVDGVSYLVFVAPALLISTVVMSAMGETTHPVLGGFTWNKTFFAAASTPLEPRQIAGGFFAAILIRFVWQGTIFWVFMLIFGASPSPWSWLVVPIGVLAGASLAGPMMAFSATREDGMDPSFVLIQRFVIMPMFLFAGTFFPLEVMPVYLRWIGWVSPIWHGTQLARVASYASHVPWWLISVHLAFLLVTAAVGLWAATRVFRRRLTS